MLFEKKIREKRISPFYLELLAYVIISWVFIIFLSLLMFAILSIVLFESNKYDSSIWLFFIPAVLGMCLIYPVFLVVWNPKVLKQWRCARNNGQVLSIKDIHFVDYWVDELVPGAAASAYTGLYLFFTEPYIYKIGFLTLQEDQTVVQAKEFKFCSHPNWTYRFRKNYRRYKDEFLGSGFQDIRCRPSYTSGNLRDAKKYGGKDDQVYYMYITYEKAQVFNRLFELMKPPKFRIVYNAKGNILMELQPIIPGKEYPTEALKCMEKINAMYL